LKFHAKPYRTLKSIPQTPSNYLLVFIIFEWVIYGVTVSDDQMYHQSLPKTVWPKHIGKRCLHISPFCKVRLTVMWEIPGGFCQSEKLTSEPVTYSVANQRAWPPKPLVLIVIAYCLRGLLLIVLGNIILFSTLTCTHSRTARHNKWNLTVFQVLLISSFVGIIRKYLAIYVSVVFPPHPLSQSMELVALVRGHCGF